MRLRRQVRATWGAALFAAGTALAPPAAADEESRQIAVAQELFERAEAAQAAGQWQACEEYLAEAIELKETPGLRFHLGFCKEQQSRWVEALVDYRRVEALLESGIHAPDVAAVLATSMASLQKRMPKLRLDFAHTPPGTRWYLDGHEQALSLAGQRMPVDPGARELAVSAPGYEDFVFRFNVLPEEDRVVDVVLIAQQRSEPENAAPSSAERLAEPAQEGDASSLTPQAVTFLAEGVFTAAALGLGIASSLQEAARDDKVDSALGQLSSSQDCRWPAAADRSSCQQIHEWTRQGVEARSLANAGYALASVGAAALLLTWVLWPDEGQGAAVQAAVTPTDGGAKGSLRLAF